MIDSRLKQVITVVFWTTVISFVTGLATMATVIYWP